MDPVHPRPLLASGRDLPHGIRPAKGAVVDPEHRPIPAPDGEQQSGCQRPPRKSHSKSQRWPSSGDSQPRQATVYAVQPLSELSPVTPGDVREVTGGQGGSPVQIRPSRLVVTLFRIHFYPHRSQQKSGLAPELLSCPTLVASFPPRLLEDSVGRVSVGFETGAGAWLGASLGIAGWAPTPARRIAVAAIAPRTEMAARRRGRPWYTRKVVAAQGSDADGCGRGHAAGEQELRLT